MSQFLALYAQILKNSTRYILSCYLGYKIVDNLKKKFLIWRGYPQCAVLSSESDKTHYEMGFTSHEFLIHQPSTGLLKLQSR